MERSTHTYIQAASLIQRVHLDVFPTNSRGDPTADGILLSIRSFLFHIRNMGTLSALKNLPKGDYN